MSRIASTFARLQSAQRKALIPFITAGDPDPGATVPLMHALTEAGADVIELGVPFSDPMADGPTIQSSSQRALANGMTLKDVIELAAEFRRSNDTPIVLFSYLNPILRMGFDDFAVAVADAGI